MYNTMQGALDTETVMCKKPNKPEKWRRAVKALPTAVNSLSERRNNNEKKE